ncbi:MAG TPA: hypothetical protein VNT50_08485 [Microbacterium sp.]|uniref:hypothetical protein n=1 Tax=Microbacterium sp. TaxID=51671 RepID=UPI002CDD3A26|nr:hypothetical protein [Microbacterium sp.]HWI31516.1 hypothetical protein [Microbacterium sp.]
MEDWEEGAAESLERLTGSPMADALHGTITIVSLSEPRGWLRYQECRMEVVLEAPGLAPENLSTEFVLDRRYWPKPGTVLRARISKATPRLLDVDWNALAR